MPKKKKPTKLSLNAIKWYRRDGTSYGAENYDYTDPQWVKVMREIEKDLSDMDYKRVAYTRLWWGGSLSTVWLALDQSFGIPRPNHKPIIFETMLFSGDINTGKGRSITTVERYSTEKHAKLGHKEAVRYYSSLRGISSLLKAYIEDSIIFPVHYRLVKVFRHIKKLRK